MAGKKICELWLTNKKVIVDFFFERLISAIRGPAPPNGRNKSLEKKIKTKKTSCTSFGEDKGINVLNHESAQKMQTL